MGSSLHTSRKAAESLQELPLPLWELLWELLAVRGQIPQDPATAIFFKRVLAHLPTDFMPILYRQSLPVQPFLAQIRLNSFLVPPRRRAPGLKRRWRLFRKRLLAAPRRSFLGSVDLCRPRTPLSRKTLQRFFRHSFRAVVGSGTSAASSPGGSSAPVISMALEHCTWGGAGVGARRYLDRLLRAHVEELQTVRALAQAVSQNTCRVVLSWHNATLAGSSGWAFEDLRAQFPSNNALGILWEGRAASHPKQAMRTPE